MVSITFEIIIIKVNKVIIYDNLWLDDKMKCLYFVSSYTMYSNKKMCWKKCLTHSSITRPSPATQGPFSSSGFFRASSAASASANIRLSLSRTFKKQQLSTTMPHKMVEVIWQVWDIESYRTRPFRVQKHNPQNLLYCHLISLLIKL